MSTLDLATRIQQARDAYYNGDPILSDAEFDRLVEELRTLNPDAPAIASIGAPVPADSAWPKTRHSIPMGSLDKVQSVEEISGWFLNRTRESDSGGAAVLDELLVTEKLDGISISVTYEGGRLLEAVTRGDGQVGEAITPNVARMKGIPKNIDYLERVTLRGEIVLHKADLTEHFAGHSNARNTAAGTAKRLDGKGCEHLNVYFYRVHGPALSRGSEELLWIEQHGLSRPNWWLTTMGGARTPQDLWVEYQQSQRDELVYEIDGLVVGFNDLSHVAVLGELHGRPRGAVAFKFPPITRETVSTGVVLQVGGQGHITPVAEVAPVNLLGATVRRASLYNWRYIDQIGFYVGARVTVTRANDVIPRILSVASPRPGATPPPDHCPECGSSTEWDGEYVVCPNTAECPAQVEGRLRKWVTGLGILEWGDVLIEKVVRAGLATTVAGLYRLSEASLAELDRMGPASARKAREQLWSVLPVTLDQLLGSLGIPLCSTSTLGLVVGAGFGTLEAISGASVEQLQDIGGVGPKRAQALCGWLSRNQGLLREMQDAGVSIKAPVGGILSGKSVCFTGKMREKRPVLERLVKDAGGQVKGSVGKGLTFLVTSDPNSTSSKAVAARRNGTRCLSEDDFLEMLRS